jgi:calcium/calmodulin-dependent protein kinase I
MRTACGTPSYTAPEVLLSSPHRSVFATRAMQQQHQDLVKVYEGYGLKADMWSLGVVAYVCLCGYLPFGEEDGSTCELFRQIVHAKVKFHSQYWRNVSPEAKDLVRNLLRSDPTERLSADQVLLHPWLQSGSGDTAAGAENSAV